MPIASARLRRPLPRWRASGLMRCSLVSAPFSTAGGCSLPTSRHAMRVPCPRRHARAQQRAMPVIGFLNSTSPDGFTDRLRAFRQGLKETGFVEGENVTIEFRWAEDQYDRLPAQAADLVRRGVTVIVVNSASAPVA